jgi:hypothetical protein
MSLSKVQKQIHNLDPKLREVSLLRKIPVVLSDSKAKYLENVVGIVFNVQYFQCLLHCREINFTDDGHFKILLNSFCVDLEHISESIL